MPSDLISPKSQRYHLHTVISPSRGADLEPAYATASARARSTSPRISQRPFYTPTGLDAGAPDTVAYYSHFFLKRRKLGLLLLTALGWWIWSSLGDGRSAGARSAGGLEKWTKQLKSATQLAGKRGPIDITGANGGVGMSKKMRKRGGYARVADIPNTVKMELRQLKGVPRPSGIGHEVQRRCGEDNSIVTLWIDALHDARYCPPPPPAESEATSSPPSDQTSPNTDMNGNETSISKKDGTPTTKDEEVSGEGEEEKLRKREEAVVQPDPPSPSPMEPSEIDALVASAKEQCGSWCIWDLRPTMGLTGKPTGGWLLTGGGCFEDFESPHSCDEWAFQRPNVTLGGLGFAKKRLSRPKEEPKTGDKQTEGQNAGDLEEAKEGVGVGGQVELEGPSGETLKIVVH